jgi:hypothetical protein
MNISSSNNSSNQSISSDYLFRTLTIFDHIARYYGVLVHLAFVAMLIVAKEQRTRSLLYVNHATIVNSFYCIMIYLYMFSDRPSFANESLNNVLCSMSEIAWIFSSYVRMYSITLIAVYRLLAVYKPQVYKRLTDSTALVLLAPILLVWCVSFGFPVAFKYLFSTTSGSFYCLDGYSPSYEKTIMYYAFNYTFNIIVPLVCILGIYGAIIVRLKKLAGNLHERREGAKEPKSSTNRTLASATNAQKQRRFAHQFLLMGFSVLASSFVTSIFALRNVINNYLSIFYYWRPVLRIYIILVISIVPLLSIYMAKPMLILRKRKKTSKIANTNQHNTSLI